MNGKPEAGIRGTGSGEERRSPAWAYALCVVLIAAAFGAFVFSLDRYPIFTVDESWFNEAAARAVSGQAPHYVVHTGAPYAGDIVANQGPCFPRLQTALFRLIGLSHFACRFPGYLGAHAAVLLLCLFLLRRGLFRTAVVLAAAWLGDRSTQVILGGRPDGVCLLLVALAFMGAVWGLDGAGREGVRLTGGWLAAGFCLGMAAGCRPFAACFFGLALVALALTGLAGRAGWRAAAARGMGAVLPLAAALWLWVPHVQESVTQFLWYGRMNRGQALPLWDGLRAALRVWPFRSWAQWWQAGLVWCLWVAVLPLGLKLLRRRHAAGRPAGAGSVPAAAAFFALAGLAVLLSSGRRPHDFLFFTIWPVIGLAALWETVPAGRLRRVLATLGLVLALAWLPSLAWNAMRFREVILWYGRLDKQALVRQIEGAIPPGADVRGDPAFFVVARQAGLRFTPLPWYGNDPGTAVPPDAWLLLSPEYVWVLNSIDPGWLAARPACRQATVFEGSPYTRQSYFIYGPAKE